MKQSIEDDIKKIEEIIKKKEIEKDTSEELLTKIQFYQHERFIHLIVTVSMGIACIIFLLSFIAFEIIPLLFLFIVTLCLFIPYVFHYYHLENGTQKLYELYFEIKKVTKK